MVRRSAALSPAMCMLPRAPGDATATLSSRSWPTRPSTLSSSILGRSRFGEPTCPQPQPPSTSRVSRIVPTTPMRFMPTPRIGLEARDLRVRVNPAGLVDPPVLGDEPPETGSIRQPQNRRETRARHQVRIVEDGPEAMADSHPTDALLCADSVTVASHILLAQQGIRASRPAAHRGRAADPG